MDFLPLLMVFVVAARGWRLHNEPIDEWFSMYFVTARDSQQREHWNGIFALQDWAMGVYSSSFAVAATDAFAVVVATAYAVLTHPDDLPAQPAPPA